MKRERKEKHFVKKPVYPGGRDAMRKFIRENLKYPKDALKEKVEGRVTLKYSIDHTGKVIDTHIVSGLGHGCDEEAARLVKLFKFKVPKTRKMRVLFHKDIHIHFKLPKKRVVNKPQVVYQYSKEKPDSPGEKPNAPATGYQYTITITKSGGK